MEATPLEHRSTQDLTISTYIQIDIQNGYEKDFHCEVVLLVLSCLYVIVVGLVVCSVVVILCVLLY